MPIVDQCVYLLIVENAEDLLILLITLATKIEVIMPESTRSFVFAPEITKLSPLLLEDCVSVYIHQLIQFLLFFNIFIEYHHLVHILSQTLDIEAVALIFCVDLQIGKKSIYIVLEGLLVFKNYFRSTFGSSDCFFVGLEPIEKVQVYALFLFLGFIFRVLNLVNKKVFEATVACMVVYKLQGLFLFFGSHELFLYDGLTILTQLRIFLYCGVDEPLVNFMRDLKIATIILFGHHLHTSSTKSLMRIKKSRNVLPTTLQESRSFNGSV